MSISSGTGTSSDPYIIPLTGLSTSCLADTMIGFYYAFMNATGEDITNLKVGGDNKDNSIFSDDNVFGNVAANQTSRSQEAKNANPTPDGCIINGEQSSNNDENSSSNVEFGTLTVTSSTNAPPQPNARH